MKKMIGINGYTLYNAISSLVALHNFPNKARKIQKYLNLSQKKKPIKYKESLEKNLKSRPLPTLYFLFNPKNQVLLVPTHALSPTALTASQLAPRAISNN